MIRKFLFAIAICCLLASVIYVRYENRHIDESTVMTIDFDD